MATIENFLLKFKVDGQQAIDKASSSVKNLSNEVQNLGANLGPVGNNISGLVGRLGPLGAAAGAAGLAFAALGLRAIQLADEIQDISDATDISAGALLNFKQSVIEAGGKAEDFSQLAIKLNQTIGEAATGSEKAQKAFKELGVFVTDAGGNVRSTETILRDAITRLGQIEDPATRSALAVDLFGKAAGRLDVTKLSAMRDPVADADIKRLAEYQAAIDRVRNSLERGLISFFGKVSLEVESAIDKLTKEERRLNELGITRNPTLGSTFAGYTREGGLGTRYMTEKERAEFAERKRLAEMERLNRPQMGQPRWQEPQAPGGFGRPSDAEIKANAKALADYEERLQNSVNQTQLQEDLRSANAIQAIQLNAAAQIARARTEIYSRERLTKEQKDHEFAEKEIEIHAKAVTDIAKLRAQTNAKAFAEEEAQREENRRAIAEYEKSLEKANKTAREQSLAYEQTVYALEEQIMLEKEVQGMNDVLANGQRQIAAEQIRRRRAVEELAKIENLSYEERLLREADINAASQRAIELIRQRTNEENIRFENAKKLEIEKKAIEDQIARNEKLAEVLRRINGEEQDLNFARAQKGRGPLERQFAQIEESARKTALEAGRAFAAAFEDTGDGLSPERAQELANGLNAISQGYARIAQRQKENLAESRSWNEGWNEAFQKYKDDAFNAADQAKNAFNSFTRGLEDAFVSLFTGAKMSWRDFINGLIADFARIEFRKMLSAIAGTGDGKGSVLMTLFNWGKTFFGRAGGGSVSTNTPYIVGERGAELFVPNSAGTIIPNKQLSNGMEQQPMQVTYNINAVDAASFRALVARDPSFIFAVTEQGRRSQPTRRLV